MLQTFQQRHHLRFVVHHQDPGHAVILSVYRASTYHIPITGEIRCLNLSTAVGIALYESLRGYAADAAFNQVSRKG